MDRLVECVPNFSEGRNRDTVRALVDAVRAIEGVVLLDEEMDYDHHRAVLTFVGPPDAVAEAAFRAARVAAGLIDLRRHQGGHPRVGATDVVPFVPIRGVTMADCAALARTVGERTGRELGIPVFLYERAASRPERGNLEAIRKGGLEGLARRMAEDPAWRPDFGPCALHMTAGATVVGARPPLIAYNVNLETADFNAAKAIAKTVRFSSGGLPFVKAIGVALTSRRLVQVSMNLTNHEETPIHVAYEAVKREAQQRGLRVAGSEIVGLVPQQALVRAAEHFLGLEGFDPTQVLETRLEMARARQPGTGSGGAAPLLSPPDPGSAVSAFLEALSAGTPTPGGGSAAALAGALAAALGVMACRIGPPPASRQSEADQVELARTEQRLVALQHQLQRLVQADAEAYEGVIKAARLPRNNPARAEAIAGSLRVATDVPLETARLSTEVATLLRELPFRAKPSVATDLKVGLLLAVTAIQGGLENASVNMKSIENQEFINDCADLTKRLTESLVSFRGLC